VGSRSRGPRSLPRESGFFRGCLLQQGRQVAEGSAGDADGLLRHEGGTVEQAKVVELAGMVEYQEGAVVSRTLIKREEGTVTLFAFDAGQALSDHTAPFDALVHVLEGEAEVILGGTPHRLGEGQAVLMPAHVPHAVKAPHRFKMLLVMIRG